VKATQKTLHPELQVWANF